MKTTTDHNEIKRWAEANNARPELLTDPDNPSQIVLRLDFPGKADDVFLGSNMGEQVTSWKTFFEKFEELNMAFEYDDEREGNDLSDAHRFVLRQHIE